ncbi:MAG: aminotransferase class V-fold PLP-dependent enzyme [Gemmatimonadaceae bacterium]|uniref:aminotransferase class V-fold PLP-dependent enzyme n=1 Tax=Gemmatimonas sp. UBA7669 TaxID=1946568 RepID=UPI0025C2F023|nr:aminotransferase class V-fold PLP-dependent enzyme [Gemmatimonas sp. UBA7669]MBX9854880.1 aminotransferase class V-fold PLP-dependent enzyme [Gemmatimonadaceae bacterium]
MTEHAFTTELPTPFGSSAESDEAWFCTWRRRELARVDAAGLAYLDYTGASLFAASVVAQDVSRLSTTVLGNPHSHSAPSLAATDAIARARQAVLEFLGADDAEYAVIFTANASAACKLVGESFPFGTESALLLAADNHNSVVGIREFARARGATVKLLPISEELRLTVQPETLPAAAKAPSLLATLKARMASPVQRR